MVRSGGHIIDLRSIKNHHSDPLVGQRAAHQLLKPSSTHLIGSLQISHDYLRLVRPEITEKRGPCQRENEYHIGSNAGTDHRGGGGAARLGTGH